MTNGLDMSYCRSGRIKSMALHRSTVSSPVIARKAKQGEENERCGLTLNKTTQDFFIFFIGFKKGTFISPSSTPPTTGDSTDVENDFDVVMQIQREIGSRSGRSGSGCGGI